jgi:hypothetical protein
MIVAETKTSDYVAYTIWSGGSDLPVAPDASYLFVNVTDTVPTPALGDVYNPATETWSTP